MPSEVEKTTTTTEHVNQEPKAPEKTVTTTKETEGAVSSEPGAPVIKTVEKESHQEQ